MSSKNSNKKSDDKEEEKALKEAEIVAELAPNEKTRKEAEKLIETVESQSNTFARDSSEIFDTYKKGVLKITEELSKFQPQYAQSISNLMEEYLQLTKEFVDKFFWSTKKLDRGGNITSSAQHFQVGRIHRMQNSSEHNLAKSLHKHRVYLTHRIN